MAFTRTELLPFRCPACAHFGHLARRSPRPRKVGPPPYVCPRCGHHAVPENLSRIALASVLFFAAGAMGLSLLSSVLSLARDTAFLLDVFLSVAFFQLLARRVIAWRSAPEDPAGQDARS